MMPTSSLKIECKGCNYFSQEEMEGLTLPQVACLHESL